MRLILFVTLLIAMLPSTSNAQEICRKTDGSVVLSEESFKRCLKDEATAKRVNEALEASGVATAMMNKEIGLRQASEEAARRYRLESENRLQELVYLRAELEKRPKRYVVVLSVVSGLAFGLSVGFVVGKLVP